MPHIALNSAEPGIRGLLRYRPQTAGPLSELTEVLLRGPSTLTRGERELIAAYVSALNDCRYCASSHAACAAAQLPGGMTLVEQVRADPSTAPVPAKLKALLTIAAAVRESGRAVTAEQVAEARAAGGQIRETWYNWGNGHWGGWIPISGSAFTGDPQAVATSDGHEQIFADDNGAIKQNWFAPNGGAIGNWVTI